MTTYRRFLRPFLSRMLPPLVLAFAGAGALAQEAADPPARVATLSQLEGSVVFAPAGETEWADAVLNRPITAGDRIWTDKGSRAEVHAGSAVLHVDSQTFLDVTALDGDVLQARLNEGTVNARVRQLQAGENFEVDTPQLAFRASQPGDYRIDVDPAQHTTRVTVRSGVATVYGANGQAQQLEGAQLVTFAGQDLERVTVQASPVDDGFDRWAGDRNRSEDQSVAARHVPREVVGYQQLDAHGTWAQDTSYGEVWYPRVAQEDWAPYRYGRWESIAPWGWTWIDDAPWGFAPFHYGRWAMIGSRWAWVPGRIGPRPVYAPALVAFVGGGANVSFSIGSGPGIGWFPLGPGEAWRPTYRTSGVYVTRVNRYAGWNNRFTNSYVHQHHAGAVTAVRVDDFSRGRPVNGNWQRMNPADIGRAQVMARPSMPEPRRFAESGRSMNARVQAPQLSGPAFGGRPQALVQPQVVAPREQPRWQQQPRQDEQRRAQVQQMQRVQQERAQREQQVQAQRQQQVQIQREHAMRQQQAVQEQRHQQQAMQEQVQRQQWQQQQQQPRVMRQPQQQQAAPAQQAPRREGRERGRGAPEQRDDSRSQGGDEGSRGRGHARAG
ncbi:MAG: hypothetical protein JWQ07_4546 [Ramlibacter sp.]|nr:hypothetical protein [Ramlibacter sp.]